MERMRVGLDSLVSHNLHAQTVEAHRVLGKVLLDLERVEEAKQHLEEGQAMAEKSGMNGELKMYDKLLVELQ